MKGLSLRAILPGWKKPILEKEETQWIHIRVTDTQGPASVMFRQYFLPILGSNFILNKSYWRKIRLKF